LHYDNIGAAAAHRLGSGGGALGHGVWGGDFMSGIETKGLQKIYKLGRVLVTALNGVDMKVEEGEFVSIMGPSGCGKSTLLHLLGGLDRPTQGKIWINGIEISAAGDNERTRIRRENIGFVFQRFNLLPTLSAKRNLQIAQEIRGNGRDVGSRVMRMLSIVGLEQKWKHKPLELSIGEQQRVAIARALVTEPKILLADEPTGNLDSENSTQILNRELNQTILMITHSPEAAAYASRILKMKDGRMVD
jgi:putative ABC transport system ATP-binding protein